MDRLDERFAKQDDRLTKLEVKSAVDYERHLAIVGRLDKIDGHISKLVWLILSAIVGALLTFLIRGGFHVG
ncbi:hypothetical protein Pam3_29 [Pseudanabaena phage Pam3]|nr:hypothetical protein Pam3_29 [Pseudanabaena phage Pam3]